MRKIVATLLLTIVILSVFVQQVQATTVKFSSKGKWYAPWTWRFDLKLKITKEQAQKLLEKGLEILILWIIAKQAKTHAFGEVDMKLPGWTYTTDGETYLSLIAPSGIAETGDWYICDFSSIYDDYHEFYWEAYDAYGTLVDSGDVLFEGPVGGVVVPVDKFGLLVPYIGLASTILFATAATAIYVKRVKHRKEE